MEIFYSKRLNVKQDVVIDNRTALSRLELRVACDRSLYITPLLWRLTGKLSPLGHTSVSFNAIAWDDALPMC